MKSEDLCEFHRHGTLGLEGKHVVKEEGDPLDSGGAAGVKDAPGVSVSAKAAPFSILTAAIPRQICRFDETPFADPRRRAGKNFLWRMRNDPQVLPQRLDD